MVINIMKVIYETERLILISPSNRYLDSIVEYHKRNKDFLNIWEPERPNGFYTKKYQKKWIKAENEEIKNFSGLCLLIIKKNNPQRIIGTIKLSGILYGNFCSCFMGYRLDKDETGNGYMTEAVCQMLNIAFDDLCLHRVEASIIPSNMQSRRVLQKAGFNYVGTSSAYLKINGEWQAHEIYEYISPNNEI